MIGVATANIELSFINAVLTELSFIESGDPEGFDGCFSISTEFLIEGSSDSTLGGALPNSVDLTFNEDFLTIEVCLYLSSSSPVSYT